MDKAMAYWTEAGVDSVIKPMVGPAIESLDKLIAQGESGQFDFAFVDADKVRINEEGNHMHQSWEKIMIFELDLQDLLTGLFFTYYHSPITGTTTRGF